MRHSLYNYKAFWYFPKPCYTVVYKPKTIILNGSSPSILSSFIYYNIFNTLSFFPLLWRISAISIVLNFYHFLMIHIAGIADSKLSFKTVFFLYCEINKSFYFYVFIHIVSKILTLSRIDPLFTTELTF